MILDDLDFRKPTIGLTPLIDVIFILIVFFMLVSSFEHVETVPLATKTIGSDVTTTTDEIIRLMLTGPDELSVVGSNGTLETALERAKDEGLPVVVIVTNGVSTQNAMTSLEYLGAAGLTALSLQPEDAQ